MFAAIVKFYNEETLSSNYGIRKHDEDFYLDIRNEQARTDLPSKYEPIPWVTL